MGITLGVVNRAPDFKLLICFVCQQTNVDGENADRNTTHECGTANITGAQRQFVDLSFTGSGIVWNYSFDEMTLLSGQRVFSGGNKYIGEIQDK